MIKGCKFGRMGLTHRQLFQKYVAPTSDAPLALEIISALKDKYINDWNWSDWDIFWDAFDEWQQQGAYDNWESEYEELSLEDQYSFEDDEIDELLGLKLGADDFVKKSGGFSIKVLIERIRVQLRKKDSTNVLEENKSLIVHGRLKLDPSQLECEWNEKQLPDKLTTTEFLIVKELAKRPGIIKERSQLMDIAYREDTDIEDRTIDSHVKRIRKKFKKVDPDFSAIETRYGSGYRWNVS